MVSDVMSAPVWLGVNVLLISAAWRLSRRLSPGDDLLQSVMHALVLSLGCLVAAATLLGMAGFLNGPLLLGLVTAIAVVTHWCMRGDSQFKSTVSHLLPADRLEQFWVVVWGAVASFGVGHVITSGLLKFPTDFDSLMYHAPLIVQWVQSGNLYAQDIHAWSVPGNNELVGLWMAAPFSGDFWLALMNLPSAMLLAVSTLELGRLLGLGSWFRHVAALVVLTNNPVIHQLISAENDVTVAALFLSALCYGMRLSLRTGRSHAYVDSDVCLGAITIGLLAGVKYYAIGYAALAWGATIGVLILMQGWRRTAPVAIAWALAAMILSGFWYARNAALTGSPLYPMAVTTTNHLQANIYPSLWQSTFVANMRLGTLKLAIDAIRGIAGPCHVVAFLALPVSFASVLAAAMRSWKSRPQTYTHDRTVVFAHPMSSDGPTPSPWAMQAGSPPVSPGTETASVYALLVVSIVGTGLLLLITPFAVEDQPGTLNHLRWGYTPVRYGLSFLSLSVLAFARLLDQSSKWLQSRAFSGVESSRSLLGINLWQLLGVAPVVAFALAESYQLSSALRRLSVERIESGVWAANVLIILGSCYVLWSWPRIGRAVNVTASLALAAVISLATAYLSARWHEGFARHYDGLFSTDSFTELKRLDPATNRFCVLDHRPYPFFGSRREFRVYQPSLPPSDDNLLPFLRKKSVTVVATRYLEQPDPTSVDRYQMMHRWLSERPEHFVLLERGSWLATFRMNDLTP